MTHSVEINKGVHQSRPLSPNKGVYQSCTLSPTVANKYYIYKILSEWNTDNISVYK
jgi:hypothetical protein